MESYASRCHLLRLPVLNKETTYLLNMTGVTSVQLWFSRLEEERLDVKNYK